MSEAIELDWRSLPLPGHVLIEASAGTGKTYNLSLLYLRVILEQGTSARQILVTTFTDAAAQELKSRIRARLLEADSVLAALASSGTPMLANADPNLVEWLAALLELGDARQLHHRVQLAQAELDLAPIATIHGFCRRVLTDFPFESSAPFALGSIVAGDALIGECVEDFWRQRYLGAPIDAWERALVLPTGAHALKRCVNALLQAKDAQVQAGAVGELRALWEQWRCAEPAMLADLFREQPPWFERVTGKLRNRLAGLRRALRTDTPEDVKWDELIELLQPEELVKAQKTAARPLEPHPAIQALIAVVPGMRRAPEQMLAAVAHSALEFVEPEAQRRLAARGELTYDSLIENVYQRVVSDAATDAGPLLAERLFEAYPVALIDEFQDTDARQWAIFERIYRHRGTLVLIGDPKQAIYGFRGGDLHAYLQARERVAERRSMRSNHRSSAELIAAWNALYARAGAAGFADSGIDYIAVNAAVAKAGPDRSYRVDGAPLGKPLVLHLRSDERRGRLELPALRACANDIASLLNERAHSIGGRSVQPGDIAVLVDSNFQINLLRRLLQERGVPVVGSGRANVFACSWASELRLLMHALLHGNDARAIRAALATRLLGYDARRLRALDADAPAWERVLQLFAEHAERWRRQGIQAVLEALIAAEAPRLLAHADGERTLTDLRHLGELLQSASQECFGPEQLYEWLQLATAHLEHADNGSEEAQLRIESEARRVQLLTVHASKGLEFPIVFLPLAWRTRSQTGKQQPAFARFHQGHQQRLDLGSSNYPASLAAHFREDLGERMRKLYVGLTRAQFALHIYGDRTPLRFGAGPEQELGELDAWIGAALDAGAAPVQTPDERWAALAESVPELEIRLGFSDGLVCYEARTELPTLARAARTPWPAARPYRGIHSFTSLSRPARAAISVDALPGAQDEQAIAPELEALPAASALDERTPHPALLALSRLRGADFGNALHQVFEERDPQKSMDEQHALIAEALSKRGLLYARPADDSREELSEDQALWRIADLVKRVLFADLGSGLHLATLPPCALRAEFDFCFALEHTRLPALQSLLALHGGADWLVAREGTHSLLGLMKGYIDLVFQWQGRFHVLDYKSNWLGESLNCYQGPALDAAMASHHYPLQALIYTVALQRYLRTRIRGYDFDRHLGDCWYLFVRSVGLEAGAGIWRGRFARELVDGVDRLFAGDSSA